MPTLRINQWLDRPVKPRKPAPVVTLNTGVSSAPVASPFIPGTSIQYAWDSTSLGWFKRCPRYYQYKMLGGWQQKSHDAKVHLTFGTHYHSALQWYDQHRVEGLSHKAATLEVVRQLVLETADFDPDHETKTKKNLFRSVIWYLDTFEHDPAMTLVLSNGKPAVEVSFRFEVDFGPKFPAEHQPRYMLCGHLDRIVDFNGERFVMDRKTTRYAIAQRFFDTFNPDNQISLYSIAGKIVAGTTIRGVIIDAAQVLVNGTNYGRAPVSRSQDQLDEWLRDLEPTLDYAEQCALQGHWPQNDTSCDKYGGCEFRHVCSMSPSTRSIALKGTHTQEPPWNPLKPR